MREKTKERTDRLIIELDIYIKDHIQLTPLEMMLLSAIFTQHEWFKINIQCDELCSTELVNFLADLQDLTYEGESRETVRKYYDMFNDLQRHVSLLSESEAMHVIVLIEILLDRKILQKIY